MSALLETPIIPKQLPRTTKAASSPYTAQWVKGTAEFEALEPEWNAFLKQCDLENISLQHEWLSTFLKHFPQDKLAIITIRNEKNELVGAAPFSINRGHMRLFQRSLNFLRFVGSKEYIYDWMAFPIRSDVDDTDVFTAIVDALYKIRQWDVLDLQACKNKTQLDLLTQILASKKGSYEIEEGEAMPELSIPEWVEDYEADKRKKRAHRDSKRLHKKWEETFKTPITLEHMYPSKEAEEHMGLFFEQHAEYWISKTGKSNFKIYPQLGPFYRDIFNLPRKDTSAPCMTFSRLSSGEMTLGYQFGIWYQWGFMNYICSYHPEYKEHRVGILHVDELIRQCIEWRQPIYSFGQGEESYKELWAERKIPLWYFRFYRNNWARACYQADMSIRQWMIQLKSKNAPALTEETDAPEQG